ncbi:NlpE-like protein [Chryseobacterium sp. 52]|uniref:copper resistance protein NlpE N-terminal domain-containing protein n=1 Tax=Chryseobacterium sp. 52 TaxID=2035213 RepID=UPI000C19B5EB|nr:copper resistance protein NlpE N-terminal domain-containing protein [Chryseobacterium sp. 52]PIF46522.1 NlpE-like protein [Chryseobacterium sp. 52]
MKKILLAVVAVSLIAFTVSCNSMKTQTSGSENTAASNPAFKRGKYTGKTPSGNTAITFNADNTFILEETPMGSTDSMSSRGTWKFDKSMNKVILVYSNIADRVTTFSIVDEKTIQMNSGSPWTKQTSGSEYNLIRQLKTTEL